MSPTDFLFTAILLGVFILCAGLYGLSYTLGHLRQDRWWTVLGYTWYVLLCVITAVICAVTELALGWKIMLVATAAGFALIPPITWRYLETTHEEKHA